MYNRLCTDLNQDWQVFLQKNVLTETKTSAINTATLQSTLLHCNRRE